MGEGMQGWLESPYLPISSLLSERFGDFDLAGLSGLLIKSEWFSTSYKFGMIGMRANRNL